MPFRRFVPALVACSLSVATAAYGQFNVQPLKIGDPAPVLGDDTVSWIKGGPIPKWESGHVYVLDFWATWCSPCIQAIPVMTETQKMYAADDVHIVALAIWPAPGMVPTRDFVAKNGDKMGFTVGEAIGEDVAGMFMHATGQTGIPTSMIIGREGKLLYIGNPLLQSFHDMLDAVVKGEYTADVAKEMAAKMQQAELLFQQANMLAAQGNWDGAIEVIDQIIAIDSEMFANLAVLKFQRMLITLGRYDEAYAYADEIVRTIIADQPALLELVARTIMEMPGLQKRDVPLARRAIDRCMELIGQSDEGALATYAAVLHAQGEDEEAVVAINASLELARAKRSQLLAEITRRHDNMLAEIEAQASEETEPEPAGAPESN